MIDIHSVQVIEKHEVELLFSNGVTKIVDLFPFKAHLTLGRVQHSHNRVRLAWGEKLEPRPVPVTSLHLIKSVLAPAGATYTTLHRTDL